jgi:hypothetical protein
MSSNPLPKCFLAYGSGFPAHSETLESFADRINQTGTVEVCSWTQLQIGGRVLISSICRAIDMREIFIADITQLNANVLFELGYAIAKNRRIWLLLDGGVERSRQEVDGFQLLSTIGYRSYTNHLEIEMAFHADRPHLSLDNTLYRDLAQTTIKRTGSSKLLFLKSPINTDASIKLSRRVEQAKIRSIVDDPSEVRIQALAWYAEQTRQAIAVIAHLLGNNHRNWQFHNAKISFVCGLAHGFGKPILMLAHAPYMSPLDYRELQITHHTATQCISAANDWLTQQEAAYKEQQSRLQEYGKDVADHAGLQDIALGDPVAEHEIETLGEYFIRTAAYNDALVSKYSVFIGRKGTGKSASLYQLAEEISRDARNHVCVVKPVAYEVEGFLRVLQDVGVASERGFLVESLWKFLIYTELAKTFYEKLKNKPPFYERSSSEEALYRFVESHWGLILDDFSLRLEQAITSLQQIGHSDSAAAQRLRISELLHEDLLPALRGLLGQVLGTKKKVAVLIDNLDKAWDPKGDLSSLSIFIFGLLSVGGRITQDFQKSAAWKESVSLTLTIFLRSDIYASISKYAKEPDKLPVRVINWEDPHLLRRVLEERFVNAGAQVVAPEEIWTRYFCNSVGDKRTVDYLSTAVLPKPRDLIYLTKAALASAVNRKHSRIQENDILDAMKQYSRYVLDALLVENFLRIENLEEILYEFAGGSFIVSMEQIESALQRCSPATAADDFIDALIDGMFFGAEIAPGEFTYLYNETDKPKLYAMSRRVSVETGRRRFQISIPFRDYLELKQSSAADQAH